MLFHVGAHGNLVQFADSGRAFQKENTPDQFLGVLHLIDGTLLDSLMQFPVFPVGAHLRVDHVLADGSQLICQKFVEQGMIFSFPFMATVLRQLYNTSYENHTPGRRMSGNDSNRFSSGVTPLLNHFNGS